MSKYLLPPFGELDTESIEEYIDAKLEVNGGLVDIDLNFDGSVISVKEMDILKGFIENLGTYDKSNKNYIENDYTDKNGDTVKEYLQHHLDLVEEDGLDDEDAEKRLLEKLHLVRVGLYPDKEDGFATFDYSLGRDVTDYLVVILTDKQGYINYITMES